MLLLAFAGTLSVKLGLVALNVGLLLSSFSQAVNTMVYVRDSINFIQKVKLDQPDMTRMFVSFNHFNNPKDRIKKPKMTIHSIRIEYTPTLEECVRRLFNEQSSMQIFADTMLHLSDSKPKLE